MGAGHEEAPGGGTEGFCAEERRCPSDARPATTVTRARTIPPKDDGWRDDRAQERTRPVADEPTESPKTGQGPLERDRLSDRSDLGQSGPWPVRVRLVTRPYPMTAMTAPMTATMMVTMLIPVM